MLLRGSLNRETLVGTSTLNYDAENAEIEERKRQEVIANYGERIRAIQRRFNL